ATTKPTTAATTKPTDVWPGDDWWLQPTLAASAEYLRNWALTNKEITELQLDPTKNKADELGKNYRQVLFKAQFVQELFDAPFPFVDSPRPEISKEQFTRGA